MQGSAGSNPAGSTIADMWRNWQTRRVQGAFRARFLRVRIPPCPPRWKRTLTGKRPASKAGVGRKPDGGSNPPVSANGEMSRTVLRRAGNAEPERAWEFDSPSLRHQRKRNPKGKESALNADSTGSAGWGFEILRFRHSTEQYSRSHTSAAC